MIKRIRYKIKRKLNLYKCRLKSNICYYKIVYNHYLITKQKNKRLNTIRKHVDDAYSKSKTGSFINTSLFDTKDIVYVGEYLNELRLKDPEYTYDYSLEDKSKIEIAVGMVNEYDDIVWMSEEHINKMNEISDFSYKEIKDKIFT